LLTESDFESRLNNELSKIILETIKTSHQLVVDEMGWIKMDDLIKLLHYKIVGWESLRYYDILRMIDSTEEKLYEVKAKRIGPAYKNKYEWYIRRYLPD